MTVQTGDITSVGPGREDPGTAAAPSGNRRRRLTTGLALVVVAAFGFLAVSAFTDAVVYYRTPTEASALTGEHLRLSGTVVPGTIESATAAGISFAVTDGTTTMTVSYSGAPPATLRDGGDIVADGVVEPAGHFRASSLVTKCPSKFGTSASGG